LSVYVRRINAAAGQYDYKHSKFLFEGNFSHCFFSKALDLKSPARQKYSDF
jgi:hypothetical protein